MAVDLTRKTFVQGSAVAGGAAMLGGPLSALAEAQTGSRRRAIGYGPLQDAKEIDSGKVFLQLPEGFRYRLISKSGDEMTDGNPTPTIFDGMAAYRGKGTTILIRNHENRSRPGEIPVVVPTSMRYDPDVAVRGGNTKLIVGSDRRVKSSFAILGGTHTNCAGGETPWDTWITCEEIFNYGSVEKNITPGTGVPHGYAFEMPADAGGPVEPQPILAAGRFSHEAVAWLRGVLYETEDRGDAAFYRFVPNREPRGLGDLATFGGTLQALVIDGKPNFDANLADPGDTFDVMGDGRRAQPADRHGPQAGPEQGSRDLRSLRGHLERGSERLLRLHLRRRGTAGPGVGAHASPQRRQAEADLRVDRRRCPAEPRQRRRGPEHR